MRILITGGCGFVGSNIATALVQDDHEVICLDNLSRRGSEILLRRIQDFNCQFSHGDIRNIDDLARLEGDFDLLIECSAEPSVLVSTRPSSSFSVLDINLIGAINCFEYARTRNIPVIFLSTSRVYPFDRITNLKLREMATRFIYEGGEPGISPIGISKDFPLNGVRSIYGASKLSAELILQEYSYQYRLPAIINRFGVIAGPWQLGKVDQGVFTYWLANHYFGKPLKYIGFGGQGKQVRDLLHIDDVIRLIKKQIDSIQNFYGEVFNAGGTLYSNLSLLETTALCQEIVGKKVEILSDPDNRPADMPWYITDNGNTATTFDWYPIKTPRDILADIFYWLVENEEPFKKLFGGK